MADIKPVMVTGRIVFVMGNLFTGAQAKIYGTQNPKLNKQGQPYQEYGFGLAVPKSAFSAEQMGPGGAGEIWARMHEVAYSLYTNRVIPANFKMKYIDGDTGVTQEGVQVNTRKGYPGHLVFTLKTTIPPKFFKFEGGQHFQINEGIKCGDWVQVQVGIDINTGANASLYLNPLAVMFAGYGEEIVNAPSAAQIFGAQAPAVPQGASATPIGQPGFITPPAQPAYQQPMGAPQMAPQQPIQPNYGVLPQIHQPAAQPAMPGMMPQPQQPVATPGYAPQQGYQAPIQQFAPPMQPQQAPAMPGGFPSFQR